jgi:hypothetical protein
MKNQYYRISRTSQSDYSHLHLEIVEPCKIYALDRFGPCETSIEFRWQSHVGHGEWYGNQIHVEAKSVEALTRANKFIKRHCKERTIPSPAELIATLESAGIVRCVYDSRLSEFIPVTDLLPLDHVRWLAKKPHESGCYVSVVAPSDNPKVATRKLSRELARYCEQRHEEWILGGKPVEIDSYSQAPKIAEIDLKPL